MQHAETIISAVFAFLSWIATVRGNGAILKSHNRFATSLNGLIQILSFAGKAVNDERAKPGSDSGSGSGSSSS